MASYVDFTYYTDTYLGNAIDTADFAQYALRASEIIDLVTFNRAGPIVTAGTDLDTIEKIKFATCAAAEQIHENDANSGTIQSERVGNVSVTYATPKTYESKLIDRIRTYLWNTGLMYRGLEQ